MIGLVADMAVILYACTLALWTGFLVDEKRWGRAACIALVTLGAFMLAAARVVT